MLFASLGWLAVTGYCVNEIDTEIAAAIDSYFASSTIEIPHSKRHNIVQCDSCGSIYIIYVRTEETSMGAYRAVISSVNQVLGV